MSRKQATFSQLVDYFEEGRQDEKYNIYHNLYSTHTDAIKAEFRENARFFKQRKNGVYLYHEILSITKTKNLSNEQQKEILKNIGLDYIKNRAEHNLVFGVLHEDKDDNLHYHFMISSNEIQSDKKHRLSKEQFSEFKKNLEESVLKQYPELEQKKLISKERNPINQANEKNKEKLSNKGAELKRRTGKTEQRDNLKQRLKTVFSQAKTKADFFNALEAEQLSIYVHGNTIGIVDKITERKHRLSTLGMMDEFNAVSSIIESAEMRKDDAHKEASNTQSNTVNKAFSTERINTQKYHQAQHSETTDKAKPRNEPATEKTEKRSFTSDRVDTRKLHERTAQRTEPPSNNNQQHREDTRKPTNEQELNANAHRQPNEPQSEPLNERERELQKRREAMKNARETKADYSNDYSKGK